MAADERDDDGRIAPARSGLRGSIPDPRSLPLPSNLEVEQALLGAILVNNDAYSRVSSFLRPAHFWEPLHRAIYQVVGEMLTVKRIVTPGTLRTFLPADLELGPGIKVPEYLAMLAAEATTVINAWDFARTIVDLAHRRELHAIGDGLAIDAKVTDRQVTIGPIVEAASAQLFALSAAIAEVAAGDTKEGEVDYHGVVDQAEARLRDGVHAVAGVSTGLLGLDHKLLGLDAGDLVILAGRPSMGKSILGLNIAARAASRNEGVLFDSRELTAKQVRSRLLSDRLEKWGIRVPYSMIDRGRVPVERLTDMRRAADALDGEPLVITNRGGRIDEIPGMIREARRTLERVQRELRLYVVDYLGLVRPTDRYRGDRVREVGEISGMLKQIAQQERLPILALHQLNRSPEARKDRRPTLSDLRDAGNLEQDADAVLFVYREAYYHERPGYEAEGGADRAAVLADLANELEVIIGKQRQGPVGTARLFIDVALNAVRDLQR